MVSEGLYPNPESKGTHEVGDTSVDDTDRNLLTREGPDTRFQECFPDLVFEDSSVLDTCLILADAPDRDDFLFVAEEFEVNWA